MDSRPKARTALRLVPLLALAGGWAAPAPLHAQRAQPSFDCAKARGYAAITICGSHDLSVEDALMADGYRRLLDASTPEAAARIRREQAAWLARRDACTSETCLTTLYKARNEELTRQAMTPDAATATLLTGSFAGTLQPGEYQTALMLDEDLLSMDRDAIVQISGAKTPATERALNGLTLIAFDNDGAAGRRIAGACTAKCRITGTIEQIERGNWVFRTVSAVQALPDDHDFAAASSRYGGPAGKAPAATNGEPPRDVATGDPLRKVLLDALRPAIERDLGQPVQFVVKTLRKQNEWAFATVLPQTKAGGKIDFTRTRHAEAIREGQFDGGTVFALLRNQGGKWIVRHFVVGPTDVAYAGWPDQYGAPYPLFGLPPP